MPTIKEDFILSLKSFILKNQSIDHRNSYLCYKSNIYNIVSFHFLVTFLGFSSFSSDK
jgi:hypothetical protein